MKKVTKAMALFLVGVSGMTVVAPISASAASLPFIGPGKTVAGPSFLKSSQLPAVNKTPDNSEQKTEGKWITRPMTEKEKAKARAEMKKARKKRMQRDRKLYIFAIVLIVVGVILRVIGGVWGKRAKAKALAQVVADKQAEQALAAATDSPSEILDEGNRGENLTEENEAALETEAVPLAEEATKTMSDEEERNTATSLSPTEEFAPENPNETNAEAGSETELDAASGAESAEPTIVAETDTADSKVEKKEN